MPRLSDRVSSLQESAIRKLDYTVRAQKGVHFYRLNIGQPDVPTPEPLMRAISQFHPKVISYGPASGIPECREAAAQYHSRWSSGLAAEHISVTVGGSEALLFAFTAICDPGDEILCPEPFYTNYNGFATVAGARIRPLATKLSDGFALPSDEELSAALTPRTRAIVFANPGNPTGAVYQREELQRLLDWAKRNDIWVIADEVYRRIWFEQPPTSALEFVEHRDRVVVIDSMSKTYSACGLRVGFFITRSAPLMEKVERLGQARLGVQPLAQHVAIAGLRLPEEYYEGVRLIYQERVKAMLRGLSALSSVSVPEPKGAFYSMVELPISDSEHFARWLVTDFRLKGESVVVAPGGGFYANPSSGKHQIRLAAVQNVAELEHAVSLLVSSLEVYPGRTH